VLRSGLLCLRRTPRSGPLGPAQRSWLEVRFHETETYRYSEVGPEVVEECFDAESKGQYFNEYRPRTLALASWTASEIEALVA
jgi:hypothetical protein